MSSEKWFAAVFMIVCTLILLGAATLLLAVAPSTVNAATGAAPASGLSGGPSVQLEKGIYAEETAGDLDAAIKIYQDIVAQDKANRPLAAQAQYRLAMCYLKKGDKARATAELQAVLATYSQEKEVAVNARRELANLVPETRQIGSRPIELKDKWAFDLDTDKSMQLGQGWPDAYDVSWDNDLGGVIMIKPKSEKVRIMAVPEADNLLKAIRRILEPDMQRLLSLSQERSVPAKRSACSVVLTDEGHLAVLEVSQFTPQQATMRYVVGTEQELAKLVETADTATAELERLPVDVMTYIVKKQSETITQAEAKKMRANSHIYAVDAGLNLHQGFVLEYVNSSNEAQAGPIYIANFGPDKPNFILIDGTVRLQAYEVRQQADPSQGKWGVWWTPDEPVPAGGKRLLASVPREPKPLPKTGDQATLTMQNQFGPAVLENFFLVVPRGTALITLSEPPTSKETTSAADIYLWQKEIKPNSNHQVTVRLTSTTPGDPEANKREAENLATAAWQLWQQRKLPEAEAQFQKAVAKDPGNSNAWNGLGWSQMNQGKPANAKASFEKAVALEPKHAAALNGLGWIAKNAGKAQEAIVIWKRAVEAVPTATAAWSGLASTYLELGQRDQAIDAYQQWLKVEPDNADAKAGLEKAKAGKTP